MKSSPLLHFVLTIAMGAALLFASPNTAQSAGANGITVEINKATSIRLPVNASVVTIADPEIADVDVIRPDLVSISGRGVGQTTVSAFDNDGIEILNESVTVTHNISALNRIVKQVVPESDVKFRSIDGALVLTGKVDSPLQADQIQRIATPFLAASGNTLVNMLEIQHSDQVLLKVKVAEISRGELKRFGINLASVLNPAGNFAFGFVNGRSIATSTAGAITRNAGDSALGIEYNGSSTFDINGVIDALAEDNMIKVLAEPNLTTASGRAARFLAGGEIPIPVPGQDGQVTIDWREYGVSLNFTPTVLSKNKISLAVQPEVSELSELGSITLQGFDIPSITTRRAETTVELASGQSFAIAGLMSNNSSNDVSKFPGLGEIPVLGALFRSTEFQHNQTELVIIITPYIVRGAPQQEIAAPTDGFQEPSDVERILLGKNNVTVPAGGKPAAEAAKAAKESAGIASDGRVKNPSPAQMRRSGRFTSRNWDEPVRTKPVIRTDIPVTAAPTPPIGSTPVSSTPVPQAKPVPPAASVTTPPAPVAASKPNQTGSDQLRGPVGFMLH